MKSDYKNWIPRIMLCAFLLLPFLALILLAVFLLFTEGTVSIVLSIAAAIALLFSLAAALWCLYAYRAFSYDGKRRLSAAIIEGTASYIKLSRGREGARCRMRKRSACNCGSKEESGGICHRSRPLGS